MAEIDLIKFYQSENSITTDNKVVHRMQYLNKFTKILNNSMFDTIIFSDKKNINVLNKILKCACKYNDINLVEKICKKHNELYKSKIDNFESYINLTLNYNSYDVFVYFYDQEIPKNLFIIHPYINPRLLKFLLDKNDNCLNYHFYSILLSDSTNDIVEIVKLLLKYNIDLEQENIDNSNKMLSIDESLLFLAININTHILNLVFKENYFNSSKKTFLHNAVKKENYFIVKYLIEEKKLNVNETDVNLSTPLHIACKNTNLNIVKILLLNGAEHTLDKGNRTPIYYAVIKGNIEILKILIQYNANIAYVDSYGKNLLEYANEYKNQQIVNYLIKKYKWIFSDTNM